MTRFEQLVVSDARDTHHIPRVTGSVIVNVDDIVEVEDLTFDTAYRTFFHADCPAGIFATIRLQLRTGQQHTLLIGQFADEEEAAIATNQFTEWLTGRCLVP